MAFKSILLRMKSRLPFKMSLLSCKHLNIISKPQVPLLYCHLMTSPPVKIELSHTYPLPYKYPV